MKFIDGRPHPEKFNQLQKFKKENVKHFPGFDLEDEELFFDLDASLITLPKSFNLDKFVNAVCLPNKFGQFDKKWNGQKFTISGFGRISDNPPKYPTKLQLGQGMKNHF